MVNERLIGTSGRGLPAKAGAWGVVSYTPTQCPLSGVMRTSCGVVAMSANDPERTWTSDLAVIPSHSLTVPICGDAGMKQATSWTLAACLAVFISGAALAEDIARGAIKPLLSAKFSPDNDVKCLLSGIEAGDPTTGRSTLILKASAGCVVPWHFHTAEEQLIIISGTVLAEMTDHQPTRLGPGGFAVMGGHMAHQFTCQARSTCLMIVAFDGAYDIYWGKGG